MRLLHDQHHAAWERLTEKDVANCLGRSHIALDAENFVADLEERRIRQGWHVKVHRPDNVLCAVMWSSPEQIRLANEHGQVVVHDNSPHTNRWQLALGVFVVVTNHGKSAVVAICLIFGQSANDYRWQLSVYRSFLANMFRVLITDACPSVRSAVVSLYGEDFCHFWCLWHILLRLSQNCPSKLAGTPLAGKYQDLINEFMQVQRQVDQDQAWAMWATLKSRWAAAPLVVDYLQFQWGCLPRWCLAWQQVFTCGILASQRAEQVFGRIKSWVGRTTRLEKLLAAFTYEGEKLEKIQIRADLQCGTGRRTLHNSATTHFRGVPPMLREHLTL
jgi:hypothetical protein